MFSTKTEQWLHRMDWVAAVASLGYGLWAKSPLWLAFGALAIVLAWWNPTARLRVYLQAKLLKRQSANAWRKPQFSEIPGVGGAPLHTKNPPATPYYTWTAPTTFRLKPGESSRNAG